jgi:hypothetical protein
MCLPFGLVKAKHFTPKWLGHILGEIHCIMRGTGKKRKLTTGIAYLDRELCVAL